MTLTALRVAEVSADVLSLALKFLSRSRNRIEFRIVSVFERQNIRVRIIRTCGRYVKEINNILPIVRRYTFLKL